MRFIKKLAAGLAGTGIVAGAVVTSANPALASNETRAGCPSGYVCLYNTTSYDSGILAKWSSSGAHNLSNVYNDHVIYNNQTDNWIFKVCTGYNGAGCGAAYPQDTAWVLNFTPINSVYVGPS
ncbi:hypothetical protein [Actinoplanes siamensis]|nr:hypothetical protein [Actinoplanes siamensis]